MMMHLERYRFWIESEFTDEQTKKELKDLEACVEEIEDRFYKDLEFGTGGLRGVIGVGTNRMNTYTVAKTSQGLANYLLNQYETDISIAIAYDSRHMSREFALKAADVFSANGIKVYISEILRSTPELSFAVRQLGCKAGIVITASHNPPQYNGYKVYNDYGAQILDDEANSIIEEISKIDFNCIKYSPNMDKANILYIDRSIDDKYIEAVKSLSQNKDLEFNIGIVYTPLHGTGNIPVRRVLRERGFNNVHVVQEQEKPDPNFSTVKYPNPEDVESYALAIDLAKKVKADIILATDPDCDRVGLVVKDEKGDEFVALNGNQVGALLLNYILQCKKEANTLTSDLLMINTVVTSDFGEKIAQHYGVQTLKTLTGFKYIADTIRKHEESGQGKFVFGYEESYGYLAGDFVRDKDAVISSMLIAEMSAYYKKRGMSVLSVLNKLYDEYNFYIEETVSLTLEGISGQSKINKIMEYFRENKPSAISGKDIKYLYDFKLGLLYDFSTGDFERLEFPKSNVLKFYLEDDSWFAIRPSGTEPKVKIYFSVCGKSDEEARESLKNIKEDTFYILDRIV
jgi:phosphoglucomutase